MQNFLLQLSAIINIAAAQIIWSGNQFALTSVSQANEFVVLYTHKEPRATQFLYTKSQNTPAGLYDVVLRNEETKQDWTMQMQFDIIAQTCSCYWITAQESLTGSKFADGLKYRIVFKNATAEIPSALFGLSSKDIPTASIPTRDTPKSSAMPMPTDASGDNTIIEYSSSSRMTISYVFMAAMIVFLVF